MDKIPYPIDAFPTIMRNAAYEEQNITKAPMAMIGSAMLSAVSLACQSKVDVERPGGLKGPTSLFFVTIAESGERKSAIDKNVFSAIHECEKMFAQQHAEEMNWYSGAVEIYEAEKKALFAKLKMQIKKGLDTSQTKDDIDELNSKKPVLPRSRRLIMSDTTPAALKDHLSGEGRSVGILSDEGGVVFGGSALNNPSLINTIWSGGYVHIDRKNRPPVTISDARLTLSIMVQQNLLNTFQRSNNKIAKDSGFNARCLFSHPVSTQGYRQINNPVTSREHMPIFSERIKELILSNQHNDRIMLQFSPTAASAWIDWYNFVETQMASTGELFEIRDCASKIAENTARIAALLHFFRGDEGDITPIATNAAETISSWYLEEYQHFFSIGNNSNDENELFDWIIHYCHSHALARLKKNIILQYGPVRLRNKKTLEPLLNNLAYTQKIIFETRGRTTYLIPVNSGIWHL